MLGWRRLNHTQAAHWRTRRPARPMCRPP